MNARLYITMELYLFYFSSQDVTVFVKSFKYFEEYNTFYKTQCMINEEHILKTQFKKD